MLDQWGPRAWRYHGKLYLITAVAELCLALFQVATGVAHLHSRGLLHRDLAARNVLVRPSITLCMCFPIAALTKECGALGDRVLAAGRAVDATHGRRGCCGGGPPLDPGRWRIETISVSRCRALS